MRLPPGWRDVAGQGTIRLTGPDRSTLIAVSSPAPAREARGVFRAAIAAIEDGYRRADVQLRRPGRLAGLPAASADFRATNAKGARIVGIVAVARGRRRAYLVQAFAPARGGRLGDAQLILSRGLHLRR